MLARFRLAENGTDVRKEVTAGVTTFMTMSYILCVQPSLLAVAGMDSGAVLMATCISSALATFLMGLLANYPVALAPAMGHNFFFVFTVCGTMAVSWQVGLGANLVGHQVGLGANLVAGLFFLLVTICNLQGRLVGAIPDSLRHGIAVAARR